MKLSPAAAYLLTLLAALSWQLLLLLKQLLALLPLPRETLSTLAKNRVVLVTTGRQAKTLHIVRALKQIGATVIVTDYAPMSASAASLACDKFVQLRPLQSANIDAWIADFHAILLQHRVDLVLPVSTINEVLFLGLAKQRLSKLSPHVKWFCPDLDVALLLDDRTRFSTYCDENRVPVPEHGLVTSSHQIPELVEQHPQGIILKRIESTVNRTEEIVKLLPAQPLPKFVTPSPTDPWQWQTLIRGDEFSVWYVCDGGEVNFSACYHSRPDLLAFDAVDMHGPLDVALRRLIKNLNLTGQFAFDFFVDEAGRPFVIECNPRASSILETVSETPCWAEAFFGVDVLERTVRQSVGFLYHRNCWPFANRREGYLRAWDPLPFFAAEIIWPLNAVAETVLEGNEYNHVDVNICKVVRKGPSVGRDFSRFLNEVIVKKVRRAKITAQ